MELLPMEQHVFVETRLARLVQDIIALYRRAGGCPITTVVMGLVLVLLLRHLTRVVLLRHQPLLRVVVRVVILKPTNAVVAMHVQT